MRKRLLHENWVFCKGAGTALDSLKGKKNDSTLVTLPHDAMILNERQKDLPYGNCVGYFPYETVHYTKTFQLEKANCVYLEFEGVYMNYSVFVNDCLAGQHINGYTPFLLDISPLFASAKTI